MKPTMPKSAHFGEKDDFLQPTNGALSTAGGVFPFDAVRRAKRVKICVLSIPSHTGASQDKSVEGETFTKNGWLLFPNGKNVLDV